MRHELIRETRWLASSRTTLLLAGTALAAAVWGAVAGASSTAGAISTFHDTLSRYRSHGEDIAGALAAPSVVGGSPAQEIISNPLRYDLDQAALAYTQLLPSGAVSATLSLGALLFFPLVGLALGVFVSTHDVTSGSIVFRWPRSGLVSFTASKSSLMLLVMCALAVATGVIAVPLSFAARLSIGDAAADVASFIGHAPSFAQVLAIGGLAVTRATSSRVPGPGPSTSSGSSARRGSEARIRSRP